MNVTGYKTVSYISELSPMEKYLLVFARENEQKRANTFYHRCAPVLISKNEEVFAREKEQILFEMFILPVG